MSLKRSCSNSDATGHSTTAELPLLRSEIILQVFTHKSLQQPAESVSNERLAELGHQILRMAITYTLFHHKEPVLDVERIIVRTICLREGSCLTCFYITITGTPQRPPWRRQYRTLGEYLWLKKKSKVSTSSFRVVRHPAGLFYYVFLTFPCAKEKSASLQERRFLFCTYVGAVCVQDGIQAVQTWIEQLIRPDGNRSDREKTLEADNEGSQGELLMPPAKRIKIEPGYINTSQGQIVAPVLPPRLSSLPRFSNLASNPSTPSSTATQLPPVHELQEADLPPSRLNLCDSGVSFDGTGTPEEIDCS